MLNDALFIALAIVANGACVAIAWRDKAALAALTASDAAALARELRALPHEERRPELQRRSPPGSWERRLAEALADAQDERARVAATNELLAEVDHTISACAGRDWAVVRIAAKASLLLAVVSWLAGAAGPAILSIGALGFTGALVAAAAGRAARAEARRQRGAIDALVAAVTAPRTAPAAPRPASPPGPPEAGCVPSIE